jgi:hypothetical protein
LRVRLDARKDWFHPRRDLWIAAGLAALVVATRLPFATRLLYSWDSVNFAEGMRGLNIALHAPHPPGYPYYVALARAVDLFVGDANVSLVLISIVFAALAVIGLYFYGRVAFDEATGIVAALSLVGSLTFWAYGTVALSYTVLSFFSIVVALATHLRVFQPHRAPLWQVTLLYALAGGFRPDLLLFLGPLWLLCLLRATWRERMLSTALAGAGFAVWFIPTALLSGGLGEYWAVFSAYFFRDVLVRYSTTHNGLPALGANLRELGNYVFYALYAQTPLVLLAVAWLLRTGRWRKERAWWLIALWIAPMLAFYTIVHIGDPGYVFAFLPGLCLLMGRLVSQTGQAVLGARSSLARIALFAAITVALAANAWLFLFRPMPLSATGIRRGDTALEAKLRYMRESYAPDEVAVLSYTHYKHLRYYLPANRHSLWVDLFTGQSQGTRLPPSVRYVVVFDDGLEIYLKNRKRWRSITPAPGVVMYETEVQESGQLVYGMDGIDEN